MEMAEAFHWGDTHLRYDQIGQTYASTRTPDARIEAQIQTALGDASSVLNVGAGAGSYEPVDRTVIALEPSGTMIAQRRRSSAPAVRGISEALPFADDSFDAVMAVLTLHHWKDREEGLSEIRRVARRRVVILTYDPAMADSFWLDRDYLPTNKSIDARNFPDPQSITALFSRAEVLGVPIPANCCDGFLCAYWKRPEAYLSPSVQAGISSFSVLPRTEVESGLAALADDLATGRWFERNEELKDLEAKDFGYRLIIADVS